MPHAESTCSTPPKMHAWGGLHPHADVILRIALSHPDMIKRPLTWLAP